MTTTTPNTPSRSGALTAAVAAVTGVVGLVIGVGAGALIDNPKPTVTASPSPSASVSVSPAPSSSPAVDLTDSDGFGKLLLSLIAEQSKDGEKCTWARPGIDPPANVRTAIVEQRGDTFDPSARPVLARAWLADAKHDAQGGLVLVHRWCTGAK